MTGVPWGFSGLETRENKETNGAALYGRKKKKNWWGQGTVLAKTLQLGIEQAISPITELLFYHWCNKVPQISGLDNTIYYLPL